MAEAFLGLKISVLLYSGIKLEGTVSYIEPTTQQMTMKDVTLFFTGQPPHYTPVYGVVGKDIQDLQVLEAPIKTMDHHVLEQVPQKIASLKPCTPKNRINNSNNNNNNNSNKNRQSAQYKKHNVDGWAGEDVNMFKEQEFDFQKNLDMFDKAKEFAKIRENDETAPEELLVTINRLPPKNNLLPSENVLAHERTAYNNIESNDDMGNESDNESQTPDEYARQNKAQSYSTKIVTVNDRIVCPTVSPLQMAHVEHECINVSSSFEELLVENSGRGASLLILQVLGKMNVVSPSVVILAGNNKNGMLGLIAARHLVTHGCLVTVCILEQKSDNNVESYETIAKKFGVNTCYQISELDGPTLVVDAILGSDDKLVDIQDQTAYKTVCDAIDWANRQSKPILSIDFPSGIDASTGIPHHTEYMIHPEWTLCLGAPRTGCKSTHITGELYLIDIGIPNLCWKRAGITGNTIPWGADFLVALEYNTV